MRVGMMMRDTEYRDAMIEMISGFDKDIFVEVAGSSGVQRDSVILTDILPSEIESASLEKIRRRTVFLSSVPAGAVSSSTATESPAGGTDDHSCHVVFKYSSLSAIMAELSLVYSLWTGDTGSISPSTRVIAVTGDSDHMSADRCRSLAGQILYRHGGSVLILPMGYISDYRAPSGTDDRGWFRRLMYMIDEGAEYLPESFTYTDSYGISYLRLPDGPNPLTDLGAGYLEKLVAGVGRCYDTLILDVGSCYSSINMKMMTGADNILFFGSGRRIPDISAFLGSELEAKVTEIGISDPGREAIGIDDFVSETYGRTDQEKNDPEVQKRDRGAGNRPKEMADRMRTVTRA